MLYQLVAAALILTAGSVLQSALGFGIGLIAIPLLLWLGFPLPAAVAGVLGAGLVQTAVGSYALRREIRWRPALTLAGLVWLGIPVGVLAMEAVLLGRQDLAKQVVGAVVLAVLTARLFFRPEPRAEVHPSWRWLAGSLAGFLAGLVGMGGPPLVFYALAHDWSPNRFRAFLWVQLLLAAPIVMALLTFRAGTIVLTAFAAGLAMAPLVWVGTRIGLALSARWETKVFQRGAVALLYAIGLSSIVAPLLLG